MVRLGAGYRQSIDVGVVFDYLFAQGDFGEKHEFFDEGVGFEELVGLYVGRVEGFAVEHEFHFGARDWCIV